MKANTLLPLTVVPHDCGTTTLHRAKLIARKAEPGGSRGTVVIVRTRVGFGVSLVGGGARVQVFERSICAPNGHFWRLLRYT